MAIRDLFVVMALLGLLAAPAFSADIVDVRYHVGAERTRVVLDLDGPAEYQVQEVDQPHRVVIDISSARLVPSRTVDVGKGGLKRIRFNQLGSRSQVVLDVASAPSYRAFSLPPHEKRGYHRIVIDLAPMAAKPGLPSAPGKAAAASLEPAAKPDQELTAPGLGEPYVVVIDPGHGGRDVGTVGCGIAREKTVVLAVARQMSQLLSAQPGIEVVLTRRSDSFVDLEKRVAIARQVRGDLFVSIHANSAPRSKVQGAEVFFLSPRGATDQATKELADRENAALTVGVGADEAWDDDIMSILMDLKGTAILQRSSHLAEFVLEELGRTGSNRARSVKQARFAVLRTLSMPSILVEVGFLSNKSEARWLNSAKGQRQMAEALASAVLQYFGRYGEKGPIADNVLARRHRVRRGDTLWELAREYGTSVKAIQVANHLTTARLRVGQELLVP